MPPMVARERAFLGLEPVEIVLGEPGGPPTVDRRRRLSVGMRGGAVVMVGSGHA